MNDRWLRLCRIAPAACLVIAATAPLHATTYNVSPGGSGTASISGAIAVAAPGDTIVLANGNYSMAVKINGNHGTASQKITLKALNRGMAVFHGNTVDGGAKMTISRNHWVIDGLTFQNVARTASSADDRITVVKFTGASDCIFKNNIIDACGISGTGTVTETEIDNTYYIQLTLGSKNNVIERNTFSNDHKTLGIMVGGDATNQNNTDNIVRYNHFYMMDAKHPILSGFGSGSGFDPYRLTVEHNLFEHCAGIHNKSGSNTYRYNTFKSNANKLILRQGADCVVESNYFLDSRGLLVWGPGHTIHNNYFGGYYDSVYNASLRGTITIGSGTELTAGNYQAFSAVNGATISNNTLYLAGTNHSSSPGINWGHNYNVPTDDGVNLIPPQNNTITNNVVVNNIGASIQLFTGNSQTCPDGAAQNNAWSGNIVEPISPGTQGYVRSGISNTSANMTLHAFGYYKSGLTGKGATMPYRPLTSVDVGPGSTYVAGGGGGGTAVTYEAESLSRTFSSGDSAVTHADVNCSNGQWVLLAASGANDWIEFPVNVTTSGTYTVSVKTKKMSSRGQCVLLIDGTQLGGTWDQYSSTAAYTNQSFGTKTLSAGSHTFRFRVTGKNASSNDYDLSIDAILLTP